MKILTRYRKNSVFMPPPLHSAFQALWLSAPLPHKETFTWKVQSHYPSSSVSYQDSLVRLKNVLEERTDGRLKLELYESGALFKARETFKAVSRGIIEMGTINASYAQDSVSLAAIAAGLPFAFQNVWEAVYFHENLGFEQMLRDEAAEHGVYWATEKAYPTEMVIKKPINSWEDFTRLKIRSTGSLQRFLSKPVRRRLCFRR